MKVQNREHNCSISIYFWHLLKMLSNKFALSDVCYFTICLQLSIWIYFWLESIYFTSTFKVKYRQKSEPRLAKVIYYTTKNCISQDNVRGMTTRTNADKLKKKVNIFFCSFSTTPVQPSVLYRALNWVLLRYTPGNLSLSWQSQNLNTIWIFAPHC